MYPHCMCFLSGIVLLGNTILFHNPHIHAVTFAIRGHFFPTHVIMNNIIVRSVTHTGCRWDRSVCPSHKGSYCGPNCLMPCTQRASYLMSPVESCHRGSRAEPCGYCRTCAVSVIRGYLLTSSSGSDLLPVQQ